MAGSTTQSPAKQIGIQEWVEGLAAMPAKDFTLENVQNYILTHGVKPETLEKYLFFSKGSYTRNLIFKNEVFECMAICWEIGQHSRVHNHRDQNCWMSAPVGRLLPRRRRGRRHRAAALVRGRRAPGPLRAGHGRPAPGREAGRLAGWSAQPARRARGGPAA